MGERVRFICDRRSPEHYFHFELLDSQEALRASYALRFQVYCRERGFLPISAYPNGLETDAFDARSLHFGAFHRSGEIAGTVRLVRGTLRDLPISERCQLDRGLLPGDLGNMGLAEVSRLSVSSSFRRRAEDGVLPDTTLPENGFPPTRRDGQRRGCPELVLGLYKIMYQETKRRGIGFWFAAMEPSLARLLKRFNFSFQPVGPEVDYYGPVTPYVARIADLESEVFAHRPDLLQEMVEGLEPDLMPSQLHPVKAIATVD